MLQLTGQPSIGIQSLSKTLPVNPDLRRQVLADIAQAAQQRCEIINTRRELRNLGVEAKFQMPYVKPADGYIVAAKQLRDVVIEDKNEGIELPAFVTTSPEYFAAITEVPEQANKYEAECSGVYSRYHKAIYNNTNVDDVVQSYRDGIAATQNAARHENEHHKQYIALGPEKYHEYRHTYLAPEFADRISETVSRYAGKTYGYDVCDPERNYVLTPNNVIEATAEIACAERNNKVLPSDLIQFKNDVYSGTLLSNSGLFRGCSYGPDNKIYHIE